MQNVNESEVRDHEMTRAHGRVLIQKLRQAADRIHGFPLPHHYHDESILIKTVFVSK
jgi:hypothetical protein